jgi:hypothetical protein
LILLLDEKTFHLFDSNLIEDLISAFHHANIFNLTALRITMSNIFQSALVACLPLYVTQPYIIQLADRGILIFSLISFGWVLVMVKTLTFQS